MSSPVANQVAYLRTSRLFPEELGQLVVEVNRSYNDIAAAVNSRTIGLFPVNRPAINGEEWFLTSQRQQGLRQVYTFTAAGNVPHGLKFTSIAQFTTAYGSFFDGTNYYGVIYGSDQPILGQISFYITPTNIVILDGTMTPTIQKGTIVLQWISNV